MTVKQTISTRCPPTRTTKSSSSNEDIVVVLASSSAAGGALADRHDEEQQASTRTRRISTSPCGSSSSSSSSSSSNSNKKALHRSQQQEEENKKTATSETSTTTTTIRRKQGPPRVVAAVAVAVAVAEDSSDNKKNKNKLQQQHHHHPRHHSQQEQMSFLASSTTNNSSLKCSSGTRTKESSYSSKLMNAPHKKGSHHHTAAAAVAAGGGGTAPFRRTSTSSAVVAEHRDTSPANNENRDAENELLVLAEKELPQSSLAEGDQQGGHNGFYTKSSSQALQRSRGRNRYTTYSSKGAFRHHSHPRNNHNNTYHHKHPHPHQHHPNDCRRSGMDEKSSYQEKSSVSVVVSDPPAQQDEKNGLHHVVAAQEPAERFVTSTTTTASTSEKCDPKSTTRGSKDLPSVSSTSSTNLATHSVRQQNKKSYYHTASTKRGKFARITAPGSGSGSGSGGRHRASKFRNWNGPREMDQTPPVVLEHVQEDEQPPQTNAGQSTTSPGPLLNKEQSDTSKFVMESSTQTEQADIEHQETLQREKEKEEEAHKVVTSNAAGLALLHRLSQGMPPKEGGNTNANLQDEEAVSSHFFKESHTEAETNHSMEVNVSLTTNKSSLKEEMAALDIGTTSENDTYGKNVRNNQEQPGLEPSMQDESFISSHEATKEECETRTIAEEEIRENNAGAEDQYIDEENLTSSEQNEYIYPPLYPQSWMIYPMTMPSNGYPPAPQQEFFYPRFLQQFPIQQPMACITAPAPYNEYTMAPYVTYGYPAMDYGGYPNSESAVYEEYMLPPMDGSAGTAVGNINMMENRSMNAPLKYEQTVIGGTVYFNPVYVEDNQNVERTEEAQQEETHRDQEEQDEIYYARREWDSGSKNANKSVLSKKTKGKKKKHRKYGTNPQANA